jgi:hypothetical protein
MGGPRLNPRDGRRPRICVGVTMTNASETAEALTAGFSLALNDISEHMRLHTDTFNASLTNELEAISSHTRALVAVARNNNHAINLIDLCLAAWLEREWGWRFPEYELNRQDWLESALGQFALKRFFDRWVEGCRS